MTRYCIIGAGPAGLAALKAMLDAGHEVAVWNRTASKGDELVARGARRAPDHGASEAVGGAGREGVGRPRIRALQALETTVAAAAAALVRRLPLPA